MTEADRQMLWRMEQKLDLLFYGAAVQRAIQQGRPHPPAPRGCCLCGSRYRREITEGQTSYYRCGCVPDSPIVPIPLTPEQATPARAGQKNGLPSAREIEEADDASDDGPRHATPAPSPQTSRAPPQAGSRGDR